MVIKDTLIEICMHISDISSLLSFLSVSKDVRVLFPQIVTYFEWIGRYNIDFTSHHMLKCAVDFKQNTIPKTLAYYNELAEIPNCFYAFPYWSLSSYNDLNFIKVIVKGTYPHLNSKLKIIWQNQWGGKVQKVYKDMRAKKHHVIGFHYRTYLIIDDHENEISEEYLRDILVQDEVPNAELFEKYKNRILNDKYMYEYLGYSLDDFHEADKLVIQLPRFVRYLFAYYI